MKTFLNLPNGIPSHDTMDRLLRHLKADQVNTALSRWRKQLVSQLAQYQIFIDGKELRGTILDGQKHASVQILSAWVREASVQLGELRISAKSNEIDAAPELLQLIDLQSAVATADALNCQKKTAQAIIDGGGDYLLALKENQGSFFEQVADQFDKRKANLGSFMSLEKDHGRIDRRTVWVDSDVRWLDAGLDWPGFKTVIMVERARLHLAESKPSISFYISSLPNPNPQIVAGLVRGHWAVENQLHRHLDVTFSEDSSGVRANN